MLNAGRRPRGAGGEHRLSRRFLSQTADCTILSKIVSGASRRARPSADASHAADASSLYAVGGARKYLNADERSRVLAAIEALPRDQALFALTLAMSGARVSELLALTASSYQVERGVVAIRTLKRRRHAMREVPLPPALMLALDAYYGLAEAQRDPQRADRRLWPWCRQTGWRVIKKAMLHAGISGRAAAPRGLRHAFGIATLQADVPLNLVSRWMGHSRLSTTAIYTAASGPEERAFAARFWQMGGPDGSKQATSSSTARGDASW